MRSTAERIRHALLFEVIGLVLLIGGGWVLSGISPSALGVVGVGSSIVATIWNYVFNLGFDRAMLRWRGTTRKTIPLRVAHALLFEAGLLIALLPGIAWYLNLTLWQAFVFDIGIAVFYIIYAFVFNWAYDHLRARFFETESSV